MLSRAALSIAAALAAASASGVVLAQGSAPRALSPELEALNPPVPADLVLTEDRRVPAEKTAAAYIDRNAPTEGAEVFDVNRGE